MLEAVWNFSLTSLTLWQFFLSYFTGIMLVGATLLAATRVMHPDWSIWGTEPEISDGPPPLLVVSITWPVFLPLIVAVLLGRIFGSLLLEIRSIYGAFKEHRAEKAKIKLEIERGQSRGRLLQLNDTPKKATK